MVVGEGKPYLAALVVLNPDLWQELAEEYGLDPAQAASLHNGHLQNEMLRRIRSTLRGFPGYAKIRRVALLLEPWTVDNGLLTPTLKIKRQRVLAYCAETIESLYRHGPADA
jgi:long-chain acyl-CoA synthetase